MKSETIAIEVIYALPGRQTVLALRVATGATLGDALQASGLALLHPDLDLAIATVGIWGKVVDPDTPLREGDRIEIYRPLVVDPKRARRDHAQHRRKRMKS